MRQQDHHIAAQHVKQVVSKLCWMYSSEQKQQQGREVKEGHKRDGGRTVRYGLGTTPELAAPT